MAVKLAGLAVLLLMSSLPAWAETEVVPLERLHVHDVILLPTVRSQYQTTFTKPKTWQVSPASSIQVEFQHSHQLLPNRSWLQVLVNDKVIKHVPLTRENAVGTQLNLPMPVALLKDFNVLTFRVEQHYTDKCEDPLDKSLWTQVLPASKLVFQYTPVVPTVDLGMYPYPIIDALTYSPPRVRYVLPEKASVKEIQAMAYINAHLAQEAQDKELKSRVVSANTGGTVDEHVAFIGTAARLQAIQGYAAGFGDYALQGNRWINRKTGQPLADDQGVVLFFQTPGSKSSTVLIVSGNNEQGVQRAAEYLTQRPRHSTLSGNALATPDDWNPMMGGRRARLPRFIENQTRTFRDLGFSIEEVHKINAPPITYHVPIVGDFRNENGKLWLDIVYSYSPDLNPEFSSLELRMNDISIANIPLTNPRGEQLQRKSIPISNELIRTQNDLVAQFHLMPDKYGWCVDNYVDNAWGKILDDSQLRLEGTVGSRLPDVGLLNTTMYPYSKDDNLRNLHIVLPENPTPDLLNTMLAFTTRLGRVTLADSGLQFSLSQGDSNLPGDKNLAVFRYAVDSLRLPDGARLTWRMKDGQLTKTLNLPDATEQNGEVSAQTVDLGSGPGIEQYQDGNRVISVLTASSDGGFQRMARLFDTDVIFDKLATGVIQQLTSLNPDINAVSPLEYPREGSGKGLPWWSQWWHWLKSLSWTTLIGGMLAVFVALLLLPLLLRRIFRR